MIFEFIIIFLVLFVFTYYIKNSFIPRAKGKFGEIKVNHKLKKLNKTEYIILNNILLKNNNSTTQIDHIVICKNGIFVIETKNYSGWIHGNEKSENWTQTIYNHKSKFKNPIKQNWIHIYAIKEILLEFKNLKYFSIIVFSGSAELKNIESKIPVIYSNRLLKTIKELNNYEYLTYYEMETIAKKLNELNISDKQENRKHRKLVKQKVLEKKNKEKKKICPKCNSELIIRSGIFGMFYGCKKYPECNYTLNIK